MEIHYDVRSSSVTGSALGLRLHRDLDRSRRVQPTVCLSAGGTASRQRIRVSTTSGVGAEPKSRKNGPRTEVLGPLAVARESPGPSLRVLTLNHRGHPLPAPPTAIALAGGVVRRAQLAVSAL